MSDDGGLDREPDGDELLDESELDPALAMPSPRVYRGSLIALLLGSIFAVWLLVLPPVGADQDSPPASSGDIVSTPQPSATIGASTVVPTATPAPTSVAPATRTPTATPEPPAAGPTVEPSPAVVTHTVVPGDTMLAIADLFLPQGRDVNEFASEIATANGIVDITQIQVGQVLEIPGQ